MKRQKRQMGPAADAPVETRSEAPERDGTPAPVEPKHTVFRDTLRIMQAAGIPFLVGGGWAFTRQTGIERDCKDLDLFIHPADYDRAIETLGRHGYRTETRFSHWLGKAYHGEHFVDLIFSSGNGLCTVDEAWFEHAVADEVLGVPVRLCPPEEMIWSKAFVMERERYDGADVAHLFHACGKTMDWARLLRRFNSHWRVLFSHLILFGFVYPADRSRIPDWLHLELMRRLRCEMDSAPAQERLCQGTLLSWSQYLVNVEEWGYTDARHTPRGNLTSDETDKLTTTLKKSA